MKKIIVIIAAAALVFAIAGCDTTETIVKKDEGVLGALPGQQARDAVTTDKSGQDIEKDAASLPGKDNTDAEGGETPDTVKKLDKGTMAIIGQWVLTKDKYKVITDYMNQKYDYKLTPEQEKEFIQFIINKKLMAMEARKLGYAERADLKTKYEWDFDDILSHVYFAENVESKSGVTPAEAKDYYDKHTGDFSEIKAQHILVKGKSLADTLYRRINSGESFDELAKKYSEDATTKEKGGALGFFTKGTMVQEFEDAAFALSDGEVSQPVKTVYGYHIIKALERKKFSYDDSKDKIVKMIKERKQQEVFEKAVNLLKKKYKVVISEDIK